MSGKTSLQKAWEVLFPYLLYYLAYNAAYLILAFAYQASVGSLGGAYGQFMTAHASTVTGVMGGLCMLAGIRPLVPMLKRELRERGEACALTKWTKAKEAEEGKMLAGGADGLTKGVRRRSQGRIALLAAALAVSTSLGLNALLTLTGFVDSSQTYRQVADRQYGVAFGIGLILYGIVSPLAEEVVFRGVIYNRLRRLYGPAVGIVVSGILFGSFHGNPVQGVYGGCLGILMAYLYEKSGWLWVPFFFHAAANLAVYVTARLEGVQERLFSPTGCAVLLAVSAGCILMVHRSKDKAE